MSDRCPLYPQKRTWFDTIVMSALCQRTHALHQIGEKILLTKVGMPSAWPSSAPALIVYV